VSEAVAVREYLPDQLLHLVGVLDRRSEVQILGQREARWLGDEANHALAPTIGPRVVDRARSHALVGRQKLFGENA
jgi:hypothetical protein